MKEKTIHFDRLISHRIGLKTITLMKRAIRIGCDVSRVLVQKVKRNNKRLRENKRQ